ncbi:peptidase [Lactiplantibacillus plantarum]|uniref:head maturation protease, ClpP-related n=1 Tax=Lactiplantibacillus plantarum TaxID=1590 RepID=UPI00077DF2A6|nr:head maturation protease, ClpP-related [Lactiplantibacillus plantarum]KYK04581.1 peptidase [Lactiplantibacillus plantarum]
MKKINVKGPIISNDEKWIYDKLEMDSTTAKDVIDALPDDGSDIEVDINSGGGLMSAGTEIYTALMDYQGKVIVNIVGMAASSASLIAMAGNPTRISPVGQIMIHNVTASAVGDYRDQAKLSDILKQASEALANAYHLKTGLPMDDLQAKMDSETYLNADQAKELRFVDEIMFDDPVELVADGGSGMLPKSAVDKITELMKQNNSGMTTARSIKPFKLSDSDIDRITTAVTQKLNVKPKVQTEKTFNPFAF